MIVTATEFKKNVGRYLDLAQANDILITKHGVAVAKISKPLPSDKVMLLNNLVGIASNLDSDEDKIREERIAIQ